eukprot:TRINITY_DN30771_c0_g1_i1.p1 TRINITY_DN30771_c0_g1~~TRINITY_DN30771_c0_g1_i1.p1  ORF type:complete len:395 (+),score=69.45 TRINITY_DN30771_c0_g1_i1:73-1257(+)
MSAFPSAPVSTFRRDISATTEVVHHSVLGPNNVATVIDPVFAEVLFVARWRKLPIRLRGSNYPTMGAMGELPLCLDETAHGGAAEVVVQRHEILRHLAANDPECYGRAQPHEDLAFCDMIRHRLGRALAVLLWSDNCIWEDFTQPAVARSAPWGVGWAVAAQEQIRQLALLEPPVRDKEGRSTVAVMELTETLECLAERLGSSDSFAAQEHTDTLTALDACAYAHLAVLYSIPCDKGSLLQALFLQHRTLIHFCDRLELRFGAWPDPRSFLAALPPEARMPAAMDAARHAEAEAAEKNGRSRQAFAWWEAWGLSLSGKRKAAPSKAKKVAPPSWHLPAFTVFAGVSVTLAALMGWGPPPFPQLALMLLKAAIAKTEGAGAVAAIEGNKPPPAST